MKSSDKEVQDVLAHFPAINDELRHWLRWSCLENFIVVNDKKHPQKGWCSRCRHTVEVKNSKHLAEMICPHCGMPLQVIHTWRFKTIKVQVSYWCRYEKSKVHKGALVARWGEVVRNLKSGNQKSFDGMKIFIRGYYIFYPPNSGRKNVFLKHFGSANFPLFAGEEIYGFAKSLYPMNNSDSFWNSRKHTFIDFDRLRELVLASPFKYCCVDFKNDRTFHHYYHYYHIQWLDYCGRYPQLVEYLSKLNLNNLLISIIDDHSGHGSINLRGKTVKELIGYNPKIDELKILSSLDIEEKKLYDWWRKIVHTKIANMSFKDFCMYCPDTDHFKKDFESVYKQTGSLVKIFNSVDKWRKISALSKYSKYAVIGLWHDYIVMAAQEGVNVQDVLYPKDLMRVHEQQIARAKEKELSSLDDAIKKQAVKLQKLQYKNDKYLIKPIINGKELAQEGAKMHNCVASYGSRYSKGETAIFSVRALDEPLQPLATVEISKKCIRQALAKFNKRLPETIKRFLLEFSAKKKIKWRA